MSKLGVDLGLYENSGYQPGSFVKRIFWLLVSRLIFESRVPYPSFFKRRLLQIFGAKIGAGVVIKPSVKIKYPWFLCVGDHTWLGEKIWIDNLVRVSIGSHCCVSQGAVLLTGNHNYRSKCFDLMVEPIVLKDGVWVGAQTVVCPGVVMEECSVLVVGAVATANCKSYAIYQGNPAQFKKNRVFSESCTS